MADRSILHTYKPEDFIETRTGEALQRDALLKKMLREEKQYDDSDIDAVYKDLFEHTAKGLYEGQSGIVSPNLNADFLIHEMDLAIWHALGHSQEEPMPHTTKSVWTPREFRQRPWSIQYGIYFHNRAFLDGEGAHITRPDGTMQQNVYTLKGSAKKAETNESQELLQARAQIKKLELENAKLRSSLALGQADAAAARSTNNQTIGLLQDQALYLERLEASLSASDNNAPQT